MNSLIRSIKKNTAIRKAIKKRIDSELNLSVDTDSDIVVLASDTNRLIDEGAIIEGDGSIWAYIKKGALEKYLNGENEFVPNIPDDYVGNVNIGHMDHATFPFPVGEWRKSDMKLVDIGDGRSGIDIDVNLDEESVFIKELKRLGYELSMSIEAYFHLDETATEDLDIPVIDEVCIFAYAVCGDGKNVNSNGLRLKGETTMPNEIREEEMQVELDAEQELEIEPTADSETPTEPETEIEEEIAEEEHQDESEEAEAEEAEEGEEPDGDEGEDEEADELAEVLATVKDLKGQVETLSNTIRSLEETNASLKKTNRKLSGKLQRENERKREFLDGVKGLSVQLFPYEDKEAETKSKKESSVTKGYYEDGIGEL